MAICPDTRPPRTDPPRRGDGAVTGNIICPDPNIITKLPLPSFYSPSFLPSLLPPTRRLTFFFLPLTPSPTSLPHTAPHAVAAPYSVTPLQLLTQSRRRSPSLWPSFTSQAHSAVIQSQGHAVAESATDPSFRGQTKTNAAATKPVEANPRFSGWGKSPQPSGRGGVGYWQYLFGAGSGHPWSGPNPPRCHL